MKEYDVIIVGAGPAGLRCAEVLGQSDLRVLILEKEDSVGDKVCAGGLTRKDLAIIDVPDEVIEHKIHKTAVFSRKRKSQTNSPVPFIFTVKRPVLGAWQKEQLMGTKIEFRLNAKVTEVTDKTIEINGSEKFSYKYLVGADGYNSIVRKYLGIPVEKKLIGLQYTVPAPGIDPRLEIHMHSKYFHSWYAWVFPHEESFAVGCVCDPKIMSSGRLKENFHKWLDEKEIDVSKAVYQSYPISYDYRGFQFGNVFLTGEAGGFASGFTGEGIYQSLVSGDTAARTILDGSYDSEELRAVIKYNSFQNKIMRFLSKAGPVRGSIHELIVILLNNKRIKAKINTSFS